MDINITYDPALESIKFYLNTFVPNERESQYKQDSFEYEFEVPLIPTPIEELSDKSSDSFYLDFPNSENNVTVKAIPDLHILDATSYELLDDLTNIDLKKLNEETVNSVLNSLEENLEPKQMEQVYMAIDGFFDQIASSFDIKIGKNPFENVHYLNRNKEYVFMVNYNIPADFPETVYMQVDMESSSDELPGYLADCNNKNHNGNIVFKCQDLEVPLRASCQIPLDKNASEMPLKMKFFCNNTCTSMFNKSAMKFKFFVPNGSVFREMIYNIKISERSNRDEKVSQKKRNSPVHQPSNVEIKSEQNVPEYQSEHKKQLPKLDEITTKYMDFDIVLGDNKRSQGKEFFAKTGEKINFNLHFGTTAVTDEELFIKAMVVDPKNLTKVFACCEKHRTKHVNSHVMHCLYNHCEYVGVEQGYYNQDRLAILLPVQDQIRSARSDIQMQFLCNNSCFYADKKDTAATLIFTLENAEGTIYARRCFNYKIVERPSRCKFTTQTQAQKRRADDDDRPTTQNRIKNYIL